MKLLQKIALLLSLILVSCEENYTIVENTENTLSIIADNTHKTVGNTIYFNTVTSDAEILNDVTYFVNEVAINTNSYTATTAGTFTVKASYQGTISAPITITFHPTTDLVFKKRVLLEDYTGTWCGWCVRVAYAIEQLHSFNDIIPVAIHRQQSTNPNAGGYDPFTFDSTALESLLNDPGYPKGYLNRMTKWINPEDKNLLMPIELTQTQADLGIAIQSHVNDGNVTLNTQIKLGKDYSGLKLVVYVLENGLLYKQVNYTNYHGGPGTIQNYTHNHVLRSSITNLLGNTLTGTDKGALLTQNFTYSLPVGANAEKYEIVAFVTDANGSVINVRKAALNEIQELELL